MKKENIKLLSQIQLIVILLLLFAYIPFVFAQSGDTGVDDTNPILEEFAANDAVRIIFGNPGESLEEYKSTLLANPGEEGPQKLTRPAAITIHLCFWLIFFVAFSDIFATFLPFTNKFVPWIVGGAFTIAFANLGFIPFLVVAMAKITAGFGAISIVISMMIAFFMFFIAAVVGGWAKVWFIQREMKEQGARGRQEIVEGIKTAEQVGKQTIKGR